MEANKMDRFDKEFLDSLKYNVEKAEENLKNSPPEKVDKYLNAFISAKEDYIAFRSKFDS